MTSRFVEQAIARAGLDAIFRARASGDLAEVANVLAAAGPIDLLILGAVADTLRVREADEVVRIHPTRAEDVMWIDRSASELDLLRDVALARIRTRIGARIGVDWGDTGLELAQVALGFGATDLTGLITKKSGALIAESELKKVKGQGLVAASAIRRREIAALVRNAGRTCVFTDEPDEPNQSSEPTAPLVRASDPEPAHA